MKIALSTITALFITAALFSLLQRERVLYPDSQLTVSTYTDSKDSRITVLSNNSKGITTDLTLGTEAKFPVAGLHFVPVDSFINLAPFKEIEIKTLPGCDDFNFTLLLFEEGFSNFNDGDTHRYLQMESTISPEGDTVRHTLRDLPTPSWWFAMNGLNRENLKGPDFTRCRGIALSSHPSLTSGESATLAIESIILRRDRSAPFKIAALPAGLIILILLVMKMRTPTIRHIPIEPQSIKREPRAEKLFTTIATNYADSGFNLEICSSLTDLSPYHIRKIIQSEHHCSFPDYLKLVRIIEAERLLTETECDIKEIAFSVGFSHPSSFGRSFKEKNGISPSQFREQKRDQ